MPLDALMKQYAGAYADNFDWPQPSPQSDEDGRDETEGVPKLYIYTSSLFTNMCLMLIAMPRLLVSKLNDL